MTTPKQPRKAVQPDNELKASLDLVLEKLDTLAKQQEELQAKVDRLWTKVM